MNAKKIVMFTILAVVSVGVGLLILSRISAVRPYLGLGAPQALKPTGTA
jgi:hypothetical protein